MIFQYHNVWFVNFSGIGNGIVIVPIFQCFEKSAPLVEYYHTENQFLSDSWFIEKAGLKNLKGFSPVAWRRFKEEDWGVIEMFITEKNIDLIVNLRNEGPKYDIGYYRFKESILKKMNIDFLDLDFNTIEQRTVHQNLTGDIIALFKDSGIDVSSYHPKWLEDIRKDKHKYKNIGIGMAASQINKRWPTVKWIELISRILSASNQNIVLFPGKSDEEIKEAMRVLDVIGKERCQIICRQSLKDVALQISKLCCFVCNDTGLLHLAAAMNVPTIGLYVSTNSDVWSPYDKMNFISYQNSFINKCPNLKAHCGNCFHYYDACPAIVKYGDDIDPDKVYEIISHQLLAC